MSSLSRDHRRSLISAPLQTLITAGVSFLTVYYLVRIGGVDTLGLWAVGNLAILYGGALVLGAHQKIARDFARGHEVEAVAGLRSFSSAVHILSALAVLAAGGLALFSDVLGNLDPLSVVVLILSGSFWTLGLLARGPALYLGQFSQSNLLEAFSAVLALILTVILTQVFGPGTLQIWLPFLARSLSLLLALLYATRSRPAIMKAFLPAAPNLPEIVSFFRRNAGTSALWLATSSRMVVLRTFFGAALGPAALGLLDVAMRVPTLLVNGVSSGNQTLLVGLSAALRENDSSRVTSLLSGLAQVLILLNVPLLFGYAAYADVMFHILVGTDITELTLLTWLTTAWVGVTAVNQLAFWIVQSAGLEAKQALAYALHTVLFVVSVPIMLLLGTASTLNLVGSFVATGILAESVILWRLALSLPLFRDYVASPHFRRSLWALAISAVFGVTATVSREAEQLGPIGYIVPAGLVTIGWLASIRIMTGQWPHAHVANLNQALQGRLKRR